eukprot:SAG31_NODE_2728_length_5180_cov_2.415469_3_plen_123_part_00
MESLNVCGRGCIAYHILLLHMQGKEYFEGKSTRWEALCGILGFAELYHATGDDSCSEAFQQIWWSICQYERHNHGGIMSNEAAVSIHSVKLSAMLHPIICADEIISLCCAQCSPAVLTRQVA